MAVRIIKKSWWIEFHFEGRRYRKRSPDNTRQGAFAYELLLRHRLARGTKIDGPAPGQNISFEEFAWKWFEEYAVANNRFSEQRIKRYTLKSSLIPFFGKMRVSEIRTYDIEQYKAHKVKAGLANKTIKNHLTVLGKCLTCAYAWFEFASKPPEMPWPRCPPPDTDYLSPDGCELLLSQASGVIRAMILMALRTGMRQGELKGLQWSSVDWSNRVVIVKNSYRDREKTIGPPKNNRSRSIPLDADLYEILYRKRSATGYVFTNTNGQPFNHSSLTYHLEALCKRAGLRRIAWHTFRHTFASHNTQSL